MLKLARPWVTDRNDVENPNIFTMGALVWTNSVVGLLSILKTIPPRIVTKLTASPTNSLGQVMSTFIIGSKTVGIAF